MQVNENVNASNFLVIGNQTSKGCSSKSEGGVQTEFASYLSKSDKDLGLKISKKESCSNEKETMQKSYSPKGESVRRDTVVKDSNKLKETDHSLEDSDVMVESDDEVLVDELRAFLEMFGGVLQQVMEKFGMTAGELSQKLQELGLNEMDLLSEDGLKSFFLSMKSATVSDLIMDEKLNFEWKQFMNDIVKNVMESGISMDELKSMSEQMDAFLSDIPQSDSKVLEYFEGKKANWHQMNDDLSGAGDETVVVLEEKRKNDGLSDLSDFDKNGKGEKSSGFDEEYQIREKGIQEEPHETHFRNPILQAIEDAMNHVNQNSGIEETQISGKEVINQIVEQVKVNMNQQSTSLEMQLYPEHLGKIQIHVVSKDGVMTARIIAESEAAKQAIEGGLSNLKEAMENQNLKVEAIEVMVSTAGFEQEREGQNSFEQQKNTNHGRRTGLSELEDDEMIDETVESEIMMYSGSSVSYTA